MSHVDLLRAKTWELPKYNPEIKRDLDPGWMLPLVAEFDNMTWGRWDWWIDAHINRAVPDSPIPQIDFLDHPEPIVMKMLQNCVDHLSTKGIETWTAIRYMMDWIMYGLGALKGELQTPSHVSKGSPSDCLYQLFVAGLMQLYPFDYWGRLLSESSHGKRNGFYPTPMTVTKAMVQMQLVDDEDLKTKTVCDPCVGTGRMLLLASNHSLRLYGQDIDGTVLQACYINLFLYAPWGVKPLPDEIYDDESSVHD